jgi:mono/diheme cytochrome c family protein
MPAFDEALSDEQIAKISTFILNSWGNSYGLVTPEDIQAVR